MGVSVFGKKSLIKDGIYRAENDIFLSIALSYAKSICLEDIFSW